jgi:hypothetical protein
LQQAVHDPGHVSLRRGLRAAVVLPLLLASGTRLAGPGQSVSAFLVFGAMSLLVLADFGGPSRSRVLAYLTTVLVGIPLVAVGTLTLGAFGALVGILAGLVLRLILELVGMRSALTAIGIAPADPDHPTVDTVVDPELGLDIA